jgi:NAD(P)-dependent dehydrogenase (short-subunit alcohol dehydrogenase family)
MTTFAIIGAGHGLGASVARRFGTEGFDVALIARDSGRLDGLAAQLTAEGINARGYSADVREPASLTAALDRAAQDLGPIEVLQYSPLPAKQFLRPVLETTATDLAAAIEFSVYGPLTAVRHALPGMRGLGHGTVLFINGGSAVRPNPRYAGTSIAFAGESALAQMLHDTLEPENIHVAQLIISGAITPGHPRTDPAALADTLWQLHTHRDGFRHAADDRDA